MARLLKMSEKMILFLPAIYSLLTDLKPHLLFLSASWFGDVASLYWALFLA